MPQLALDVLAEPLAICQVAPTAPLPRWAAQGPFFSVTRTPEELSIVCAEAAVPAPPPRGMRCEPGWRALRVAGPLAFSQVGVLAALAEPLATAGISIFVVSTFATDYLLLRAESLEAALATLQRAGHSVRSLAP